MVLGSIGARLAGWVRTITVVRRELCCEGMACSYRSAGLKTAASRSGVRIMLYHVSRGGQSYGPYTLADLQRYVASGHILLTDQAQGEGAAEWSTVGEVLNPGATPAPPAVEPPPYYAPPAGYGGQVAFYPDPPNLHWALVLLFDVLTFGLFQMVWNFVMAAWLKRVQDGRAVLLYALGYGTLVIYGVLFVPVFLGTLHHAAVSPHLGLSLLSLTSWVLRLVARFSFKASLQDHFNGPEPMGYRMNGFLLFFFGGLYIQSELNRINEIKQAMRYREAAGR